MTLSGLHVSGKACSTAHISNTGGRVLHCGEVISAAAAALLAQATGWLPDSNCVVRWALGDSCI
jgi:hypothetical protein